MTTHTLKCPTCGVNTATSISDVPAGWVVGGFRVCSNCGDTLSFKVTEQGEATLTGHKAGGDQVEFDGLIVDEIEEEAEKSWTELLGWKQNGRTEKMEKRIPIEMFRYLDRAYQLYSDSSCCIWDEETELWLASTKPVYITTDPQFGDNSLLILEQPSDALQDHEIQKCINEWMKDKTPNEDYGETLATMRDDLEREFVSQVKPAIWDTELGKWVE